MFRSCTNRLMQPLGLASANEINRLMQPLGLASANEINRLMQPLGLASANEINRLMQPLGLASANEINRLMQPWVWPQLMRINEKFVFRTEKITEKMLLFLTPKPQNICSIFTIHDCQLDRYHSYKQNANILINVHTPKRHWSVG